MDQEKSQMKYEVRLDKDIPAVMRDGIRLYCDVYRPDVDGLKTPVLIGYSPFGKEAQAVGRRRAPIQLGKVMYEQSIEIGGIDFFVKRGYTVVTVSPRGIGTSEGQWTGVLSTQDQEDCCDVIQWAGNRSFSNGMIGMLGSGFAGKIQMLVAARNPKYLKAIMPVDVIDDLYLDCYPGGIVSDINYPLCSYIPVINSISEAELEHTQEDLKAMLKKAKDDPEIKTNSYYYRGLDSFPPRHYTWNLDILLHPLDGSFWDKRSAKNKKVTIPTYVVGLYYEYGHATAAAFNLYNLLGNEVPKKLLMLDAAIDKTAPYEKPNEEMLRWYDYWLKGTDTEIMAEPPIKLHVLGADKERYETSWPIESTLWETWYFRQDGILAKEKESGTAEPDRIVHIPPTQMSQMPEDVPALKYTSAPMAKDTELSGPVAVKLYASIDTDDAHFSVRVWDKDGTGRRRLLSTGHLKASHRKKDAKASTVHVPVNDHKNPEKVVPGEIYAYEFELCPISNVFKKGHSIEVEFKTMDQQYFDYNEVASLPRLYTSGRVAGPHPQATTVHYNIFLDNLHASSIVLPVVKSKFDFIK